jgi:DNA polymerase
MSRGDEHSDGGNLVEAMRHYYLDKMGIQVWLANEQPIVQVEADRAENIETRWQQLEQAVTLCRKCQLHQSRTQTVFGVGNKDASLLVIGEAPGCDEDLQGEPFVGRAGQLLNAMLAAIGLQRQQVYIANILKCRPPNNRDPRPEEADACSPWLNQQIALIRPDVILALGRVAAHNLLKTDQSLAELRGRLHAYDGVPLVVSYHPAYLLRQPIAKRKSWQDLIKLKSLLSSGPIST